MKGNSLRTRVGVGVLSVCVFLTQANSSSFAQSSASDQTAGTVPPGANPPGGAGPPAQEPAKAAKKSPLKWILIAAGGAGAALALGMSKKKKGPTSPGGSVTVGNPTVGQP
jgi:hypothetical protein